MPDTNGVDGTVDAQASPLPTNVIELDTRREPLQRASIDCRRSVAELRERLRRPIATKQSISVEAPARSAPARWPSVTVRRTTRAERVRSLRTGTKALAALVDGEVRKLLTLRALLRLAKAVEQDPMALDDPVAAETWADGLATLSDFYAVECVTPGRGQDLARFALEAEGLGLITGDLVFASGGEMTDPGNFCAMPIEYVRAQLAEHGSAAISRSRGARAARP